MFHEKQTSKRKTYRTQSLNHLHCSALSAGLIHFYSRQYLWFLFNVITDIYRYRLYVYRTDLMNILFEYSFFPTPKTFSAILECRWLNMLVISRVLTQNSRLRGLYSTNLFHSWLHQLSFFFWTEVCLYMTLYFLGWHWFVAENVIYL